MKLLPQLLTNSLFTWLHRRCTHLNTSLQYWTIYSTMLHRYATVFTPIDAPIFLSAPMNNCFCLHSCNDASHCIDVFNYLSFVFVSMFLPQLTLDICISCLVITVISLKHHSLTTQIVCQPKQNSTSLNEIYINFFFNIYLPMYCHFQ